MNYILGAGAMARETLSIYRSLGRYDQVAGFIEQNCPQKSRKIRDKDVLDSSVIETLPGDTEFIGAMGSPKRRAWIEQIEAKGFGFDTVIHPASVTGDNVHIGVGCIVCGGAVLTCDVSIGDHSIINVSGTISHDCRIGRYVTIGPGVHIAGRVTIGDGCWISIGAKIIPRVTIGAGAFIAAGAVVTEDVGENLLLAGVPAKPVREMTEADWRDLI